MVLGIQNQGFLITYIIRTRRGHPDNAAADLGAA